MNTPIKLGKNKKYYLKGLGLTKTTLRLPTPMYDMIGVIAKQNKASKSVTIAQLTIVGFKTWLSRGENLEKLVTEEVDLIGKDTA